jgi:hypothetical protein
VLPLISCAGQIATDERGPSMRSFIQSHPGEEAAGGEPE